MDKKTIVAFHIGRGGRFHNPGHLSFLGVQKIGETSDFLNNCFPPVDEINPTAEWHDGSGNSVGLTNAELESSIGTIDQDGHYDTTYTKYVADLTDDEIDAIKAALPDYYAQEVLKVIEEGVEE